MSDNGWAVAPHRRQSSSSFNASVATVNTGIEFETEKP
jgi:hypothetical protein